MNKEKVKACECMTLWKPVEIIISVSNTSPVWFTLIYAVKNMDDFFLNDTFLNIKS